MPDPNDAPPIGPGTPPPGGGPVNAAEPAPNPIEKPEHDPFKEIDEEIKEILGG